MKRTELLFLKEDVDIPYHWAAGRYGSLFLTKLRDEGKFIGNRCPACGKVYLPPRVVCGPCFTSPEEIVELKDTGTLEGYSVVNYPFIDPETGSWRPIPYTLGYIRLDGCDSYISHFVDETDPGKLTPGLRVKAVFRPREERTGRLQDVLHFKIVD